MPIPKPKKDEKQDEFVSRCMANPTMNSEYPDQKQRAAVCYSSWKEHKAKKSDEAPVIKNVQRKLLTDVQFSSDEDLASKRQIRVIAASGKPDRTGDVVVTAGIDLTSYQKNPVILWAHDHHGLPVAKAVEVSLVKGQLHMLIEFATKDVYEFADTVYKLIRGGFLKGISIGARVKEAEWIKDKETGDIVGRRFTGLDLLEASVVPIPADSRALITAVKSGAIDDEEMAECLSKSFEAPLDFTEGNTVSINTDDASNHEASEEEENVVTKEEHEALKTRLAELEKQVPAKDLHTLSERIGAIETLIKSSQTQSVDTSTKIMQSLDSVVTALAAGKKPDVSAITDALKHVAPTPDAGGDVLGKMTALLANMSTKLSAPR